MSVRGKKHTKEFVAEAVKLVTKQGYSQAEASRSLDINAKSLSRWIKQSSGVKDQRLSVSVSEQEELTRLRIEVKRLRMEREILKKAATFFANEPK